MREAARRIVVCIGGPGDPRPGLDVRARHACGGINPEDIAAPRCVAIEARLRELLVIPVSHDDQHGTAIVVLGALTNALRVVGEKLAGVRIVVNGVGAAGRASTPAPAPIDPTSTPATSFPR